MNTPTRIAAGEPVLGGQRSDKSRRVQLLAGPWLDGTVAGRQSRLIARALPSDEAMRQRIAPYQSDHVQRMVAQLLTIVDTLGRMSHDAQCLCKRVTRMTAGLLLPHQCLP